MWLISLVEQHSFWVSSSPPITFTVLPILTLLNCATFMDSEKTYNHQKFTHTLTKYWKTWWHQPQVTDL